MAEVNAKDLTTKTAPASTDSMLLFGTSTNEGAKITVDNLANNILERLATKTFPNQVGGSSAATILAQLATLNSKSKFQDITSSVTINENLSIAASTWFSIVRIGQLIGINGALTASSDIPQYGSILTNLPLCRNQNGVMTYGHCDQGMWYSSTPTPIKVAINPGTQKMQAVTPIPANKTIYFCIWYVSNTTE